jgi:hypothetical protein
LQEKESRTLRVQDFQAAALSLITEKFYQLGK